MTMTCPSCGEALTLHQIMRQVVDAEAWHRVTEGRIKPSDMFIPQQRDPEEDLERTP